MTRNRHPAHLYNPSLLIFLYEVREDGVLCGYNQLLDDIKITCYKTVIIGGNSVCFTSEQILLHSVYSYLKGLVILQNMTCWGIPLFYALLRYYHRGYFFISLSLNNLRPKPFLLIKNSCWKTVYSPLFLNISSKNRNLNLTNESLFYDD